MKAQELKELRGVAKLLGMTFKVKKGIKLNGGNLYQLVRRGTDDVIVDNYTFGRAYDDCSSGYWLELHNKWIANK